MAGVWEGCALLELSCCGRYTDHEEAMYYHSYGRGPFGLKGPPLPPGWNEKHPVKFDLHWMEE